MKKVQRFIIIASVAGIVFITGNPVLAGKAIFEVKKGDGETIQRAIDRLPASGGQVILQPGIYVCSQLIVIDRDNVELCGSGQSTILRLSETALEPVIVIGDDSPDPAVTHTNIHVRDLVIDGNRGSRTNEMSATHAELRNNGISVRAVVNCSIQDVVVHSCLSGGLVTEKTCRRITVNHLETYDNRFDGLASYQTEDSVFQGLFLHDNLVAGFSFDIDFVRNIVSDCVIAGTGKVGIFMRDSRDNLLANLQIRNSIEHGIFLAQVEGDDTTPATGNTFNGCVISASGGAGIRVNDASCTNNLAIGCQFIGNTGGCVSEVVTGLVQTAGVICR